MRHSIWHPVRRQRGPSVTLAGWGLQWGLRGVLVGLLGGLIASAALASSHNGASAPSLDPHELIQRMSTSYDGIDDYTALFFKRERIDGALTPLEKIELRFQEPFKVYMAWQEPYEGRAIAYVEGQNDDKILVNPGGLLGFMRLSLDPSSAMARRNSHHTIRQVGLENTVKLIMAQYRRGMAEGVLTMRFLGHDTVGKRPAYHLEFVCAADEAAGYYARRGEIWLDKDHYLPLRLSVYNWDNEPYAYYEYRQLRLNPGLGPAAFELDQRSAPSAPSNADAVISDP